MKHTASIFVIVFLFVAIVYNNAILKRRDVHLKLNILIIRGSTNPDKMVSDHFYNKKYNPVANSIVFHADCTNLCFRPMTTTPDIVTVDEDEIDITIWRINRFNKFIL